MGGWFGWRVGGLLGRVVGSGTDGDRFLQLPHRQFEQWRPALLHSHLLVWHVEAEVQLQHGSSAREKLRQVVGGCSWEGLRSASGHLVIAGWLIFPCLPFHILTNLIYKI